MHAKTMKKQAQYLFGIAQTDIDHANRTKRMHALAMQTNKMCFSVQSCIWMWIWISAGVREKI